MTPTEKSGCLPTVLQRLGLGQKQEKEQPLPYRLRDDFLSPAEASFYRVLHGIVTNRLLICPKVGLGDLFFVARPNENTAYRNKIARKHVDFVLCDPQTLKPLLGIELDDASHQQARRIERDAFVEAVFAVAHLPLLRIPARQSYDTRTIAGQLKAALQSRSQPATTPQTETAAPLCPKCGVPMVLRTTQRGPRQGQQFCGCPNYPQCREIIPVP